MKEIFYQSEKVQLPANSTATTYRTEALLDNSYDRCIGIAMIEAQDGGIASYNVGLEDNDKTIVSLVPKKFLSSEPAAGLKLENRLLPVNIKAGGHKVKILTDVPMQLAAELEYVIVFVLEREERA